MRSWFYVRRSFAFGDYVDRFAPSADVMNALHLYTHVGAYQ